MSRRGDNIHKRKDGRWEGRYKSGLRDNGQAIYRSVYAKTYTECKNKLDKCKSKPPVSQISYSGLFFSDVLDLWLDTNRMRLKGSTENKYYYIIESQIKPELGKTKISDITAATVNAFLEKKLKAGSIASKSGLAPSYVKTMAIIIESALNLAVVEGLCQPIKSDINKPKIPKHELTVYSHDSQKRLEEALKTEFSEVALGTLIALHTGMRLGEICALKWSDVDLVNDLICKSQL